MEVKGHVFQINDNNRKVPQVPNMTALSLTIKNRGHVIKVFSKVGHDQGHVIKVYVTTRKVLL